MEKRPLTETKTLPAVLTGRGGEGVREINED